MFGILCNDDIEKTNHCLFRNFRTALYNLFGSFSFKDVNSLVDLVGITHLFIVDEHHVPNVAVWKNQQFIDALNAQKIRTIIFNFERIYDSAFPWNVDHQRVVEAIRNRVQFVADVDDMKIIKSPFLNKQWLSRDTYVTPRANVVKSDKVLFAGQLNGSGYERRRRTLDAAVAKLDIHIVHTERKYSYDAFLDLLSEHKYVLNPLGNGSFLNLRHYEIRKLGGVPIQQVTPEMLPMYDELSAGCVVFTGLDVPNTDQIAAVESNQTSLFLEDYLGESGLATFL